MRLLSWLLCAAAVIVPVISLEERNITRPKRDSSEKKIVCYYTNWSVYRPGTAKFSPQNINPYLCTHLIYAFGGLSKENALKPFDKYQDIEQGGYAKFNGLKTYNKNLKTMLAIGGWNEGSARFSPLVADAERRKELVKNTVKFLRQNHFDGLDLDWEYPSFRDGGKPRDRDNYATLVQEFREEFERESEKTGRTRLLLTMAVPAGIEYIDKGYDVPKLNKYLDWMNILSYDYHSAFEPTINHHSPLFSLEEDDEYNFDAQLSIDYTVQHYIKLGAERSKLVLGIPTYGRSYTLFNPDATDIGSPADGPGEQGEATREKGYLAYYEICERVKSGGWSIENPNPEAMGPYAYKDNQWVGYDDEVIARAKAKYVSDNDLGGIMFWSIDNDDFRGKCHGKPYPIIEAAKEALLASSNELVPTSIRSESSRSNSNKQDENSSSRTKTRKTRIKTKSTTTTESFKNYSKSGGRTSTTPQPPTTPDPGSDFVCKDEGFFPHPRDCKKYFWCLDSGPSSLGIVAHQFTCPSGLVFNKISDSCDYARNVICKTKPETTKATTTSTTTSTTTQRTTTVRSRLIITASPPRALSTTTTTTEQPSEEEVKEDDAEDEEDPGTIKELINLIKRLGGVEQLEKQLNLQNSEEKEKIKPSLYSRVLQGRTANRYRGVSEEPTTSKYVPVFRNRPVKPQSPNTDDSSSTARVSERPQYVTIQRNRPTKIISKEEKKVEEEEESEEEVEESDKSIRKDENPRPLRKRPNNDATTEKEYVTLRRARLQKEEKISTPKYKNIVRVRSTTEATVEEEEEDDVEEEISEEEQDADEEEESEAEPDQKLKKYSAIIRENKKIETTEEESKVSGLQSPNYINGTPSPATISASEEKDNVNNVYTVTSSRYVELRRTHPSTATTTEKYVNNVNNFKKNVRKNVHFEYDANEESKREKDLNDKYFPRKITTETVKRLNSPSIKQSIIENTTPILEYSSKRNGEISRMNENFLLRTTTDSVTIPNNKLKKTYKILNRKNVEPVFTDANESNKPLKLSKDFQASTQTIPTTEGTFNNGVTRRFHFAPRTKPTFLIPKQTETTTQAFTITVPDLPDSSLTENILGFSFRSQFPSATLEPATTNAPIETDTTPLNLTENKVFITTNREYFPSSTYSGIPTTSTLTSVVTSITESSYTERKKISLPKKARFSIGIEQGHNTLDTTREETFETTKPYFTPLARYTARNSETTSAKRRRGNIQSTSTTTEKYEQLVTKFFPKKTRTVKKVVSTEVPEVTSSTTRKFRFQLRSKLRDSESNSNKSNNLVFLKFGSDRKKKNSEKNEDDLEVGQTATFFEDNFEENDRYILSGGVSQTSEKAYLNASIVLVPNSLVEGKEGKSDVISDKVSSNTFDLYKIRNTSQRINKTDSTELVRNRSVSGNSSFRNLKARTQRPTETEKERTAENKKKFFQTDNATSKINFKNLRTKEQQNINKPKEILTQEKKKFSESVTEKNIYNSNDVTPTIFKATSLRTNKHKTFISDKKLNEKSDATDFEKVDINEPVRYYTPDPNLNFKSTKIKVLQTTESPNKEKTFTIDFYNNEDRNFSELENVNLVPTNFGNSRRKFPSGRTEGKVETATQANYFQKLRGKTRQLNYNFTEVTTEGSTLKATSRGTKISSVYSSQSRRKFLKSGYERIQNEVETSTTPLNAIEVKADIRNLNYETPKKLLTELQNENEEYATKFNDDKIVTLTTNPSDSTFGRKFGSVSGFVTDSLPVQSTVHSTAYTKNENNLTRTIFNKVNPTISKLETSKIAVNENSETTTSTNTIFLQKGYSVINSELSTSSPSNLKNFRGRIRLKILNSTQVPEDSLNSVSGIIEPLTTTQSSLSSARFRNRGKIDATESLNLKIGKILNDSVESESSNGRTTLPNKRRKILVRARPVQPILEAKEKEEDNELESPEEPSKISKTSAAKGTQEYFNNIRTRGRSTTQSTITSDRSERRRTQLDRKRLRVETKTSTTRPESQTETTSSTSRSNYLLRRRTRPTTSSTTTEEPYVEQQEDSRLEESKSLDETPEIQDLADPAVVAIHNLATVSPGPINPVVTPINTYSETPATYTVHVTPSDIASFTTPARISSVTPGSVYSRPTSILTLKPYTVPVITKQYLPKQTSVSLRTPSPFRGTGISIVSEEPFNPRSEILTQSRRQETTQKTLVAPSTSNFPQKEAAAKSRRLKPFSKLSKQVVQSVNSPEPPVDYEYYDENEDPLVNIPASALKVKVHSDGYIECLDRGNFPHPFSCKKFISCAKMENNELLGWEYTCPKHLSFDPVGGICNWSAGLGCQH